jgi:hypothetical protein
MGLCASFTFIGPACPGARAAANADAGKRPRRKSFAYAPPKPSVLLPILGCCGVKTTEHGKVKSKVNRTTRSITPHTAPNSKSIVAGLFALTSGAVWAVGSAAAACKSKKNDKKLVNQF